MDQDGLSLAGFGLAGLVCDWLSWATFAWNWMVWARWSWAQLSFAGLGKAQLRFALSLDDPESPREGEGEGEGGYVISSV